MSVAAGEIRAPSLALQLLETRAVGELYAHVFSYPWLSMAPRGDGHPVLVLPGFLASGSSTFPLRHFLKRLGYKGHRWKLGRNLGPVGEIEKDVLVRLRELRERYGQKVSLIGWSLGGVYARELAWMAPDDVRQVIT
ncbi:MAG: alpha/beta hydrolase [Pseudomonadota bacterium]